MKTVKRIYRNEMPFLRLMIPFICGIVLQLWLDMPLVFVASVFITGSLAAALYAAGRFWPEGWKWRWMPGSLLQLAFLSAGALATCLHTPVNSGHHLMHQPGQTFMATVITPPAEKASGFRATVSLVALRRNGSWKAVEGNVMAYFKTGRHLIPPQYGDLICFTGIPVTPPGPQNPGEFDYRKFLSNRQVYHQVFLEQADWRHLASGQGNCVIAAAYHVRDYFVSVLRRNFHDQRSFAVASALVAGYDDEVDQELMGAYSAAGALHVLSVSGMHVGLIYQGLFLMLGFMNKRKWSRHMLYAFLICFIWFYAFITGFTPSVARSAVMLTVVLTGKWHGGHVNVCNTLVVTAFAMLVYNPYYLTEVSFQLSFLAVWGIVYLHPRIFELLEPAYRPLHWVWQLTSVSLAAQLMTFPVGLFYFHQFPNLFMLANLVVIPLSSFVIYLCIAVLIVSPVAFVCQVIAKVTGWMLELLNGSVVFIEHMPGAVTQGISITSAETVILYVMIGSATLFFQTRKAITFFSAMIAAISLITCQLYEKYETGHRHSLIVYSVPRHRALDVVTGSSHLFVCDSLLAKDAGSISYHIWPNWWMLNLAEEISVKAGREKDVTPTLVISDRFIRSGNSTLVLVDREFLKRLKNVTPPKRRLSADYVVLSENSCQDLKRLTEFLSFRKVIIDSSNSARQAGRLMAECAMLGISCHSVLHSGAYVSPL